MKNRLRQVVQQFVRFALFCLLGLVPSVQAAENPVGTAGAVEEALLLAEAIYREGVLPSGEPVQAKTLGYLAAGKKVACAGCHLRSGLGSLLEGEILVRPVSGAKLFSPLVSQDSIPGGAMKRLMFDDPRPAYSDATLAAALLTGKDPTGRSLHEVMPRFLLDEKATQAMVAYLKNLSSTPPPGVTADEIRFATIVAEEVRAEDRDALLRPLTAFLEEEWNARLSFLAEKSRGGLLILAQPADIRQSQKGGLTEGKKRYRRAVLDVWRLQGPSSTWSHQLKTFYDRQPVFAILSGIVPGEWTPIHEFCETNKIPCILPVTDLPAVAENDWYTLYFSKGLHLEGEVAARFLAQDAGLPSDTPVIQVSRNTERGSALVRGFAETWKTVGEASLTNITLSPGEQTGQEFWKKLSAAHPRATMVAWLDGEDLAGIEATIDGNRSPVLFLSATMLGEALPTLPDGIREFTYIAHPNRLPGDGDYTESIISNWLKHKGIQVSNMTIASKVFVLKSLLSSALVEMADDFYRDFFLDILDGTMEKRTASVTYPVLSFGPGERYAAKGCYVVQLEPGEKPRLIKKADWLYYVPKKAGTL